MYVCICHAVTEDDIERCVHAGVRTFRELKLCLGIGGTCGKCACHARETLNQALAANPPGADLKSA